MCNWARAWFVLPSLTAVTRACASLTPVTLACCIYVVAIKTMILPANMAGAEKREKMVRGWNGS
jgi:hypothetical protein